MWKDLKVERKNLPDKGEHRVKDTKLCWRDRQRPTYIEHLGLSIKHLVGRSEYIVTLMGLELRADDRENFESSLQGWYLKS